MRASGRRRFLVGVCQGAAPKKQPAAKYRLHPQNPVHQ
jgi:hypothetical protein